ncbi:MAG: hypothetical protein ACD_28C00285G0002 [uncultured bacterium]|nr:MAG: hypothetical protein ACD_28C00285G0002 [uncultured bacterium]KKT74786.1 MAG: ABC transporter related protein [Candidatus Peregrinibacteria bacterium GW2011_GWA2_44_7]
MNYALNKASTNPTEPQGPTKAGLKKLLPLLKEDHLKMIVAVLAILVNSAITLSGPFFVAYAIDHYVVSRNYEGVMMMSGVLIGLYLIGFVTGYIQTAMMGGVAQRMLFNLRNTIFTKLQSLPLAFFNQNKAGDLISRINNDTDKLNQFFSQGLVQFVSNLFMIVGAGIFLLSIHFKLGLAILAPAVSLLFFTRITAAWIRRKNAQSLQAGGGMSAEIQESLDNFKVIVAFNRRDYFREKFKETNESNFKKATSAGYANTIFIPVYGLCSNMAQLITLAYGIHLIAAGDFTVGLLISAFLYTTRFYDPLRHMAALWGSFQLAMATWDRISAILEMKSNLIQLPEGKERSKADKKAPPLLAFHKVHFSYPDGKEVLHDLTFELEAGKTYALVGPTGGGKTTTASLMARLYDPTKGKVFLQGQDIRAVESSVRSEKIGFILQDPFLFSGNVRENLCYGNDELAALSSEALDTELKRFKLDALVSRFEKGLETPVKGSGDTMSLGQRQLIAFMRAVLRNPELLILDEATANIDTVTEQLLEKILKHLPKETTRVIIAHRLNTIENADEIFFINGGTLTRAGSLEHAVDLLLKGKRES